MKTCQLRAQSNTKFAFKMSKKKKKSVVISNWLLGKPLTPLHTQRQQILEQFVEKKSQPTCEKDLSTFFTHSASITCNSWQTFRKCVCKGDGASKDKTIICCSSIKARTFVTNEKQIIYTEKTRINLNKNLKHSISLNEDCRQH